MGDFLFGFWAGAFVTFIYCILFIFIGGFN